MLVARKQKISDLKFDWKAALSVVDFHHRMLLSMEIFFLWLANTGVKPPFFQN